MPQARLYRFAIMCMMGQAAFDQEKKNLACRVSGTTSAGHVLCKDNNFYWK